MELGRRKKWLCLFCLLELIIYVLILSGDWLRMPWYRIGNEIRFTGILLCFCGALSMWIRDRSYSGLMAAAMGFTLTADLFLLFTSEYSWGMGSFLAAQTLYMIRLVQGQDEKRAYLLRQIIVRISGVFFVSAVVVITGAEVDGTLVLTVVYFTMFLVNIAETFTNFRKNRTREIGLFLLGLILFLMCDINVGLVNAGRYLKKVVRIPGLHRAASGLIWIFYLPSQVLLVLSGYKKHKR